MINKYSLPIIIMNISFSELNRKKPEYNKSISFEPFSSNSQQLHDQHSSQTQTFNEINLEAYQDGLSNVKKGESYYCGGDSSLAIRGMQIENSPLSQLYFSKENTSRIQKHIKKEVYKQTNGQYRLDVDQDESDLLIIMRAVFIEQGKYYPNRIVAQVKELNRKTIEYLVPDLITNIKQQHDYIRDINRPINPPNNSLNVSSKGRRTLPSVTTTFGIY